MKKVLLGTSALLAVAGVAFAGEAPKMKVSGYEMVWTDIQKQSGKTSAIAKQPSAANTTGHDIGQESKFDFVGEGKSDAGLTYKAYVRVSVIGGVSTDEASVKFSGNWGSLELGQNDGAAGDNYISGSAVVGGTGLWDGAVMSVGDAAVGIGATSDDPKVTYYSPSVSGLTIGLSYTPTTSDTAGANGVAGAGTGKQNGVNEYSVNYSNKFGDVSLGLQASFLRSKADQKQTRGESRSHFGASVGFGSVTVAGGVFNNGRGGIAKTSTETNARVYDIGIGYNIAGNTIGAGYARGTHSLASAAGSKNPVTTVIGVAASVPVADGLGLFAEAASTTFNDGKANATAFEAKRSLQQVILGTKISF